MMSNMAENLAKTQSGARGRGKGQESQRGDPCARLCVRHGHINRHAHVFLAATLGYAPLSVLTDRDAQRP